MNLGGLRFTLEVGMPGLWGLTLLAQDLYRRHKLHSPSVNDFKVRKEKGAKGHVSWYVQHRVAMDISSGRFDSEEDARNALPLMVIELKLANPETGAQEAELLAKQYFELVDSLGLRDKPAWFVNGVTPRGKRGVPYFSLGFIKMDGVERPWEKWREPKVS